MLKNKEKLFSVRKSDCIFKYYKGSGAGGQKKNKTENCCQCTHVASGAQASSEEGRCKMYNTSTAFKKMADTKEFKQWVRIEAARASGELAKINAKLDHDMQHNIRVDVKQDGLWKEQVQS